MHQEPIGSSLTQDQHEQELFKLYATPRIKKQVTQIRCTFCNVVGKDLQTCQRCKGPRYCSKECQKMDWPTHKAICVPSERSNTSKLLKMLTTNVTIIRFLDVAIALDLDLANDTRRELGFKFPLVARVDIGIEPCDNDTLMRLFATDLPVPDNIEGFVQIHRLRCGPPGFDGLPVDLETWREMRARADCDGRRDMPIGIIHIFVNGLGPFTMIGRTIGQGVLDYVRERHPLEVLRYGMRCEEELIVNSCLSLINVYIRADKENQLKLRTMMTKSDIATIRNAKDVTVNTPGVVAFREGMKRLLRVASLR